MFFLGCKCDRSRSEARFRLDDEVVDVCGICCDFGAVLHVCMNAKGCMASFICDDSTGKAFTAQETPP